MLKINQLQPAKPVSAFRIPHFAFDFYVLFDV